MKYIVVNTKDKFNLSDVKSYYEKIGKFDYNKIKFIICPSNEHLKIFKERKYCLGSQNVQNIELLINNHVTHCLVGHYDERSNGETDIDIKKKVILLQKNNIKPILCVGEISSEDDYREVIKKQIQIVFDECLNEELIMIAYEPFYAIGGNKIINTDHLTNVISFIKKFISDRYEEDIKVIYGGSVNKDNISNLLLSEEVDGYIISSGALNSENLEVIIKYLE